MNEVLHWNGANAKCAVHHIHGDKDELFPIKNVKNAYIVKGGNHLMVVSKAHEVSAQILELLKPNS
jgi:pimeloyl-ACP methyl ester carboxylesterase